MPCSSKSALNAAMKSVASFDLDPLGRPLGLPLVPGLKRVEICLSPVSSGDTFAIYGVSPSIGNLRMNIGKVASAIQAQLFRDIF
jgi:hypothetical protein